MLSKNKKYNFIYIFYRLDIYKYLLNHVQLHICDSNKFINSSKKEVALNSRH